MTINNDYNRKLLLDLLKLSKLSKRQCSFLLNKHEKSLDTYIYKFDGLAFPPSFAYFFLSSICDTSLPLYESPNKPDFTDGKGSVRIKKYNYFKRIDHVEKKEFFDILELEKCTKHT